MPAMKPGSGGLYSEQKQLSFDIESLRIALGAKPMNSHERKNTERFLAKLRTRLRAVNALIRRKRMISKWKRRLIHRTRI